MRLTMAKRSKVGRTMRHRHHFAGSETFQHAQKLTPVGLRAAGLLAVDFRAPFGTELFKLRVKSLAVGADAGVSEAAVLWVTFGLGVECG
jgi:hypothetical protein